MKKINVIAWLITMLMTLVASPAFATDWGSENVTMQVGETKTLYLPSSVTSKTLKSVNFYSASYNYVEVVSHTNYSVKVKALKATSTPVIVRCDYYYYINNGGYTYQNGGAYDFKVTVEGETTVKPTKITIPSVVSVEVGESKDIEATVTPANAEYTLTWSISDNSIATVYQNGMITGKSVGYADLKVKADNGVYAMCRVSVYKPTPSSVSMRSSLAMNVGDTYTLSPTVYPSNSQYTLTWTSSNTNVATVSSSGKVTAKSAGTANITVKTDNGKTATCKVTVSAKSVTSVSIPSTLSLEAGETYTLTPTITPSDAATSYTWSTDNSNVATVSSSGVVKAKSTGNANINVKTDNGKTAICKVTVSAKSATSVSIPSTLSLETSETYTFTPTITPSDAATSYTWSSDKSSVATVSQYGVVTGKSAGTANVTVTTDNGKSATCAVTVTSKSVTCVSIKSSLSLEVDDTYTLTPTITPSDAVTSYTWSTSNSSVATVSQSGVVTAKSAGTANITVRTDNGKTATCAVTVTAKSVTSVSIKSSLSLEVGNTYTLVPTITPSDAVTSYTWSTSNSSVATVSQSGVVIAKSAGTANITVRTDNGKTATCAVTVTAKSVTSVSIKSSLSLEVGNTYTLVPTITPSDAVTSYTWSTSNSSVATVSQSGVVTAKSAGTANITVKTDNGKTAICKVTVNAAATTDYEVRFSIFGYEYGQVLYNGMKLAGDVLSNYGSFNVSEGSDVALTILPNEGYKIDWLWVDWDDVSDQFVDNVLTIRNIRKNTDLVVSFVEGEQPVVIVPVYLHCNVGEGGYITSGNSTIMGENKIGVGNGDDITIKIVASEGYHINSVVLDGVDVKSQLVGNELSVKNMTEDRYLNVSFEKDKQDPDKPVVTTENDLTLGNITVNTGTTVSFPISLTNKDEITALQMDLHLPTGITLATDEEGDVKIETSSRIGNKHTVDCNKMTDGSYRIICYSTKNATFTGNSGELFNVELNIGADMADGDYEIMATNIELSDNTGTAYTGQDVKGKVTVKSYMLGDTDNNGKHTINDAVCIINHILNQSNAVFIEAAADLDGNGKITVNDAVQLISKYILGTPSNARKATRATTVNNEANFMSIEDVTMQPGEVKTIEVMMTNEREDIKGVQCDITLPQGITFLYDEDAEDYVSATSRVPRKLTLSSEMQDENTLRVAGVCTGSSCIYGNSGSVFTFKVKADKNIEAGIYEIQLTNVEISYGEAIDVADRSSALEILNEADGIATLFSNGVSNMDVYDLNGRHVDESKTKKGIFIINGKKVLIK